MFIALVIAIGFAGFLLGFLVGATLCAKVAADNEAAWKLREGAAPLPIVGPSGKVIGSVVPRS